MLRPTPKVLLVPFLAAALFGAGCSSTVEGTPAPTGGSPASTGDGGGGATVPGPTDDPVAWMDQVCGILLPLTEAPAGADTFDPSTSPEQAFEQLRGYLGEAVEGMDTAINGLETVGPSPIEGGDAFVQQMTESLGNAKTALDSTAQQLEGIDPSDPDSLLTALSGLEPPEGLESVEDPGAALQANPELEAAAEQAPKCQQLTPGG